MGGASQSQSQSQQTAVVAALFFYSRRRSLHLGRQAYIAQLSWPNGHVQISQWTLSLQLCRPAPPWPKRSCADCTMDAELCVGSGVGTRPASLDDGSLEGHKLPRFSKAPVNETDSPTK